MLVFKLDSDPSTVSTAHEKMRSAYLEYARSVICGPSAAEADADEGHRKAVKTPMLLLLASTQQKHPLPRRSTRAAQPSPYLSAAETSALLHASLDSRLRRLDQADMMTTDEAAALLGTSRVTVNAWINKGRCIGLTQTKRGFKVPRWQFEPVIWDHLPGIGQALGLHEGWALLNFFETPHGGLEGLTPRQALEQGQAERVLAVARAEGA